MWQSQVEIEHYSIVDFALLIIYHIQRAVAQYKELWHKTSIKSGTHVHNIDTCT